MKKLLFLALLLSGSAFADVSVLRNELGSGTPGLAGFESALPVGSPDILHAPQYMPFYPTAGTIWPRVIEVPCVRSVTGLKCDGYTWQPKLGRGEYLFIKPVVIEPAAPVIITKEVPVIIYKEVPVKHKKE
jgi:hypothetical protein